MQSFIGNRMPITCVLKLTDTRSQRSLSLPVWKSSVSGKRAFLLKLLILLRTPSSTLHGSQKGIDSSSSLPPKSLHPLLSRQRPQYHSIAQKKLRERALATSSTSELMTRKTAMPSTGHPRAVSLSLPPSTRNKASTWSSLTWTSRARNQRVTRI